MSKQKNSPDPDAPLIDGADAPIRSLSEDRLGRRSFAQTLAAEVNKYSRAPRKRAALEVFVFYRDTDGHPGEILVDWRSAGQNLGWVPEQRAWTVLCSIRNAHRCGGEFIG